MALLYDFYLSPNSRGSNRKRYHARPASNNRIDTGKLIEEAAARSVYSANELETALATILDVVRKHLAEGEHVQISGLGGFQVSLKCPETRTPQATRAGSVSIKSIAYKPDKKLVQAIRSSAEIRKAKYKEHSFRDGDLESIKLHLARYFQENRYLTRKDMETHCFLTQTTAGRKIKELVEMGILVNASRDTHHPFYELVPGSLPTPEENEG